MYGQVIRRYKPGKVRAEERVKKREHANAGRWRLCKRRRASVGKEENEYGKRENERETMGAGVGCQWRGGESVVGFMLR